MSSSAVLPPNLLVASAVTEKLTRANYAVWKAQVRSQIRGARRNGHLTGAIKKPAEEILDKVGNKIPNLVFEAWDATDQQILSFLFASMSREIMIHVANSAMAAEA